MKNSIGGKLQGISLDAFLQMAQMEEITCTLSVGSGNRTGLLYLLDGQLIDAETGKYTQLEAATRIISWEKSVIDITESCSKTVDTIKQPLMNILMEAMRLRDDAESNPPPETEPSEKTEDKPSRPATGKAASSEKAQPVKSNATASKNAKPPIKKPDTANAGKKAVKKTEKAPASTKTGKKAKPGDSKKGLPWKMLFAVLAVLIVAGGFVTYFLSSAKQNRVAYEAFVLNVEEAGTVEQKLNLLNAYVRENPGSAHSEEVLQQIKALMKENDEKAFKAIEQTASRFTADGAFEEAARVYEKYLEENKNSQYASNASAALKALSVRMENRAFEEMKTAAEALGPERISLYRDFLEKYPDSPHQEDVRSLISAMEDEFFIYIERMIQENEQKQDWGECTKFSRQYLAIYPQSDHTETVTKWLVKHGDKYQASQSFDQLQRRAHRCGTNYEAALAVYADYLKAYPGTPVREKIDREIDRLQALSEQKRLADATTRMVREVTSVDSRFSIKNNETTVLDGKSRLMWCLLDSRITENRCLTYEEATAYVSSLETGGYDDWRLPSPEELKTLYGKTPAFPSDADTWYWSSKNEKRYVSQWIIEVLVIDPSDPNGKEALMKESWQCGAVRAVRRNR